VRLLRKKFLTDAYYYANEGMTMREYFTEDRFNFPKDLYDQNESIFQNLISSKFLFKPNDPDIVRVVREVFGANPSKTNLGTFF